MGSTSMEILVENLQELSLINQRIVYDHMKDSWDDISNFVISKDLAKNCKAFAKGTHKRYTASLEAKREEKQKKQSRKKRKTIQEEIREVKRQKISLEASTLYLIEGADKLAFESKKMKNLEGM